MASTGITGAKLYLTIDGTDHAADIKAYDLSFADADTADVTFGEVANTVDQGTLKITAIQSTDTASFWSIVWANSGETEIPFVLAPHGNEVPTATQPHITGTVDIGPRPTIAAEAGVKTRAAFEVEWKAVVSKTLTTA